MRRKKKKTLADASRWRSLQGSNHRKQNSSTCHRRSCWSFSIAALIRRRRYVPFLSRFPLIQIWRFRGGSAHLGHARENAVKCMCLLLPLPLSNAEMTEKVINFSYLSSVDMVKRLNVYELRARKGVVFLSKGRRQNWLHDINIRPEEGEVAIRSPKRTTKEGEASTSHMW